MRKKEQIIMLTSSLFVLTALTMTGVYVKGNHAAKDNENQQKQEYRLDLSQLEKEGQDADGLMGLGSQDSVEDVPNNDLDYEPDLEEAASGNVENPQTSALEVAEADDGDPAKEDEKETKEETKGETEETAEQAAEQKETEEAAATGATVVTMDLHFSDKEVLTLPIVGNILINYNMDSPVYHATLEQYRLSPALVISATEGADVCAMRDAQIMDITSTAQLGNQVTMSFGDGYECIYAQLQDIQVQEGSYVSKGDVIGKIAAPTKYYSVEGPNLYLEMLKDDVPVDPMSFMSE